MLLDDERKEIFRILQLLTKEIAVFSPLISAYQFILTELDFINAKTRLARELNCSLPGIETNPHIELINAYHPILWKTNKNIGKKTLSQHISMDKFSRMLVISGPNAGGKSITLKTIGLLQLMLQSGLLVPADPNSKMCFFQQILSDIGDNQSIENELSTYSYRLKRMRHFLEVANKRTLLLLDEFGTGSDPDLGGALAEVFFEELYKQKSFGVITTHYANIKLKAEELTNAVNGCMLFDSETLEPLYRFSIGRPGSSFTFEVAQINGIPLDLIEQAKTRIDERKVKIDRLLSDLQKEKNYLERLNKEHLEAQKSFAEMQSDYIEKKDMYEQKLRQIRESTLSNERFIQYGKKLAQFIDKYNVRSRKKDINLPLLDEVRKYIAMERSKIEEATRKMKLTKSPPRKTASRPSKVKTPDNFQRSKIQQGSKVRLIATKQSGVVEEISGEQITVTFGFLRMKVNIDKLMWVEG